MVGRNHIPRGVLRARPFHSVLERLDVVRPQLALRVVGLADFPVPRRVIEPLLEALELLLGADVEIELENARAVLDEHFLEVVDQLVAVRPHRLRDQLVHAHHQYVLIVRSVEDHDLPFARRTHVGAPQEVVGGIELTRLLEAKDPRPLRIHGAEHVAHHAVLATGVERLQNDQQ